MITPVQAARTVRHAAVIARADMSVIYTWKTWLFGWLVRLICQMVFYSIIGILVGDPEYTLHIVLGAAMMTCVAETMMATASTCWDRNLGTQGLLAASPIEPGLFYFGRSLHWPASSVVTTSVALLAVPPFFGITWSLWQVPVLIGIVALTCLASYCMTMLVASFALVFDQARNIISAITTASVIAISGAMVPVEFWPTPVQLLSQLLPVNHGLAAVRAVEAGASAEAVLTSLGLMLLAAVCWLTLAFMSFRQVFARARSGKRTLD